MGNTEDLSKVNYLQALLILQLSSFIQRFHNKIVRKEDEERIA